MELDNTDVETFEPFISLSQEDAPEAPRAQSEGVDTGLVGQRAKNWVFTVNNYTEADVALLQTCECAFIHFQAERGESGTPHLQGVICFKAPIRAQTVRKRCCPRGVFLIMRGTIDQALAYASKEETREPNGIVHTRGNKPAGQGARQDLAIVARSIQDGASESEVFESDPQAYIKYSLGIRRAITLRLLPRDFKTCVIWCFGPTGSGKSRYCHAQAPDAYWKAPNHSWWDGYGTHREVIIDDYRPDFCKFSELLRLFDRYPLQCQTKGGICQFRAERLFISTPKSPKDTWRSRTVEDLAQLFRRIEHVYKFDNGEYVEVATDYENLEQPNILFNPRRN